MFLRVIKPIMMKVEINMMQLHYNLIWPKMKNLALVEKYIDFPEITKKELTPTCEALNENLKPDY